MEPKDSLPLLRSIGELSQLALAIGTSIDLMENCEYFFKHLMSRKNLIAASVWSVQQRGETQGYERVYTYPSLEGATWLNQADLIAALGDDNFRLFRPGDAGMVQGIIADSDAAVLLFRSPEIGFIVLHSYLWLSQEFSVADRSQMVLLLEKFLLSVKGCMVHRDLVQEMVAHKQSQGRERDLQYRHNRMERMEHISEVIGHTAHDLNNLFGPVLGYPSLIVDDLPANTPDSVFKDIKAIEVSAQAAVDILNDMLSISRSGRRVTEEVFLPDVVKSFSQLASFRILQRNRADIKFSFECEENVPVFTGAVVQCTQALLNLVTNASEEISGVGEINTRVSHVHYPAGFSGYELIPPGEYVLLEVQDTATGIPPEIFDRIFEPYVSRKEMGRSGSGLGLAVVYGVVKHAEGFVDIQTELGVGTCFRLHFPLQTSRGSS